MNVLTKTLGFSVLLILTFAGVTYVLPQMEGAAPEEIELDVSELTMASFVAMGEQLYHGKGACALCHNDLGRAPDLLSFDVTSVSLERLADPRYQGDADDAETYLRESMVRPSIFVVAGFGTKGSNDALSPMPAVDKPPAKLSELAIDSIIAYLQDKDGNPVTVSLPVEATESEDDDVAAAPAPAQSAEAVLAKYACSACHSILASVSTLGPGLKDIAKRQDADQIRNSIINPGAVVADGYFVAMPEFPNMTVGELEMIVEFLAMQTGEES